MSVSVNWVRLDKMMMLRKNNNKMMCPRVIHQKLHDHVMLSCVQGRWPWIKHSMFGVIFYGVKRDSDGAYLFSG